MHVFVTGGTGVVGKAAVDHLIARGHSVRLFSRDAERDCQQWAEGVEPYAGSVGADEEVRGAAEGCDAVLHVAGIQEESPPENTFENINVQGTRRLVREAERAGVRRFVFVSSLGADQGESEYHRSKRAAEEVVRGFRGDWLVCRPGNVYGPGDQVISLMLKLVRTLPVLPVIGNGEQEFQPIWVEDLGEALALAVEREDLTNQTLELAGEERTTTNDLVDRFAQLTGKKPLRLPVPEFLAEIGARAAEKVGFPLPINADQITMLQEGNVIRDPERNALTRVFGIPPTPLAEGLAKLADALPEQLPSQGTGKLHRERFWADIRGSRLSPEELLLLVREQFGTLPPDGLLEVGVEPETPTTLEQGATLTLSVPMRGHVQVRVEEITPRSITSATLEGHFFAGIIRFLVQQPSDVPPEQPDRPDPGEIRFEVRAYVRAADLLDQIGVRTVGKVAQQATWSTVVEEVVRRSGGTAPEGVQTEETTLAEEDAHDVERWVEDLVIKRRREESPVRGEAAP